MRPAASRVPRRSPPPLPDDPAGLSRAAVEAARARGFAAAGVLAASRPVSFERYRAWLEQGFHGEMAYLERDAAARMRFDAILPFTRSVLAVARAIPGRGPGNVAQYARGEDYHLVVRRHLKAVIEDLRPLAPRGSNWRVCVDTAPLLERELAARAGLGFIGKNGLLIVPGLDARKCLSYLTIEKRTPFTAAEEAALSGRLFGCDDCQDVCPFNKARGTGPSGPAASVDPGEILALSEEAFRGRFFGSAVWRATPRGLARNAAAALRREARILPTR
jgi:epoxyqueuosine reductase